MPYTVQYLNNEIVCDTVDELDQLLKHRKPSSRKLRSPNATSKADQPLHAAIANLGDGSRRLLSALSKRKGQSVSQSALRKLFGYEDNQQLSGVITALRRSLNTAGVDFESVVKSSNDNGESHYLISDDWLEAVRTALKSKEE